jgi:hypothetical protein
VKVFDVGMEAVASALAYIERIFDLNEAWVQVTETSAIGLFMTSLALSSKFLLDRFERNTLFHI